MQDTQSGKGHEVESTVQAEMIFGDAGHADLREITDGGEEGHPAEGKIGVHVVIETESQRESCVVRRAGPEPEIGRKAPMRLLRIGGLGGARRKKSDEGKAGEKKSDTSSVRHSPTSYRWWVYVA